MNNELTPRPSNLAGVLTRVAQREIARGLDHLAGQVVLATAQEQAEAGLAMTRAQHQHELALLQEQAAAELAVLHEHGRGVVASAGVQEVGAVSAAADAVAKAYPMVAPQVFKIVDAQATGAAITVMRF